MNRQPILDKLAAICETYPDLRFGEVLEAAEECAWDSLPYRHCSMRLSQMSDELFEQGLDLWMAAHGVKVTQWLS